MIVLVGIELRVELHLVRGVHAVIVVVFGDRRVARLLVRRQLLRIIVDALRVVLAIRRRVGGGIWTLKIIV